jgi:dGTPase
MTVVAPVAVARLARRSQRPGAATGPEPSPSAGLAASPFRVDRDRIAAAPFFARLAGVTQVVTPNAAGLLVHNRLTHSLTVAQVARAIAERITAADTGGVLDRLGGCDPDVVEAAALAHDLGHPPFGHSGEQVLDRLARHRLGLPDGFEGNAQTFRILTAIDVRGPRGAGMDLTAATRAAVLKYPWARLAGDPHPRRAGIVPRGAAEPADEPGTGSAKFSGYVTELADLAACREPFAGRIEPWQQTPEASVMDTADDLAYAIHDVEDFYRVGVLQHAVVTAELAGWRRDAVEFAGWPAARLAAAGRRPGTSLELVRRRLHAKDGWIVDDEAFVAAVDAVHRDLGELLAVPFDASVQAEQAVAAFSGRWTARLVGGVVVGADPHPRTGHVGLAGAAWHEVVVLKFVHHRFVLERPDLALRQRGQAKLLTALAAALHEWAADRHPAGRLPSRLRDLIDLAEQQYAQLAADRPDALTGTRLAERAGAGDAAAVRALARGRAVIDTIASLTDNQAAALLDALSGRATTQWTDTLVL